MIEKVITRFAPSPTGYLHIGGARTALFNWLFAKHMGGKMHLRIEDTDRERSTQGAIDAILDGLKWMGLEWDGEVVYQFSRAARHAQVAHEMVAQGKAYYCYATPEELAQMREQAKADGRSGSYDGRWRDKDPKDAPADIKPVVRLKAPKEGETILHDLVQGTVSWANKDIDDLVLLRSDGTPTYMLSVVVDDHDMGITHIIRGDDHLTNAARQMQIYQAMGWNVPKMAHIPLIHGPDGAKLSKRHGALGIEAYRDMGYLPEGLRNYLARLGWSHGDQEIFTTDEMVQFFNLDHVGKSPSRMDFAKLAHVNAHHLRSASNETLTQGMLSYLLTTPNGAYATQWLSGQGKLILEALLPHLKERATTFVDLTQSAQFLWAQVPFVFDEKAQKILNSEGKAKLGLALEVLQHVSTWDASTLENTIKSYVEENGLKLGDIMQPMRAAITGTNVSPPMFEVLGTLGVEEVTRRFKSALNS